MMEQRDTEVELMKEANSSEMIYKQPGPEGEILNEDLYLECQGVSSSSSIGSHKLRIISWSPGKEKEVIGVVIISHGLHEHGFRYYKLAHALSSRGIIVYACDHFAHGKSDGTRGFIPDYNILVNDFIEFGNFIHNKHSNLPISLFSHSMGTLIAILSIKSLSFLTSVIFSATPLFSGPSSSSPFGIKFLYPLTQTSFVHTLTTVLASIDPTGPCAPLLLDGITSSIDEQKIILNDPLRYPHEIRNKTASEVMKMVSLAKELLPTITIPFLCVHGEEDSIGLLKGSKFIYDNIGTITTQKNIKIYPKLRHEVLHEVPIEAKKCIDDIVHYYLQSFEI